MTKNKKKKVISAVIASIVILFVAGAIFYFEFISGSIFNVQDYIYEVQFSGTNGDGVVLIPRVNYDAMDRLSFEQAFNLSDVMDTVTYTADPYEGLSNGDKVTITADYDKTMAANRGIMLTGLTWTVEVQGLEDAETSYDDSYDQVDMHTNTFENADVERFDTGDYEYVIGGIYTVQDVLRVRENPDINARHIKRSELMPEDYVNSADYPDALLQKGSQVECLDMSGDWMKIASGWICVYDGNEILVK